MAIMTKTLASIMTPEIRAQILFQLDSMLRNTINDEDIFSAWLEEGVPDGTESWKELVDIEAEDFTEMWNLAESLLNEQAANKEEDEPHDIDDDAGYNPYLGCFDWDC